MRDQHVWRVTIRDLVVAGSRKDTTWSMLVGCDSAFSERDVVKVVWALYDRAWWEEHSIADLQYVGELKNAKTRTVPVRMEVLGGSDQAHLDVAAFPNCRDTRITALIERFREEFLEYWCSQFYMTVEEACQTLAQVALDRKGKIAVMNSSGKLIV